TVPTFIASPVANARKYGHVDFDRSQHFYRLNRLDTQADTGIGLEEAHEARHQNALASFERLAYKSELEFKKYIPASRM
ncbi:MAG: hypothetical protein QNK87_01515, partial [Octadecabacter sp.]